MSVAVIGIVGRGGGGVYGTVVRLVDLCMAIRLWKKSGEGKPGPIAVSMTRRCGLAMN